MKNLILGGFILAVSMLTGCARETMSTKENISAITDDQEIIQASADTITYNNENKTIVLKGNATVLQKSDGGFLKSHGEKITITSMNIGQWPNRGEITPNRIRNVYSFAP